MSLATSRAVRWLLVVFSLLLPLAVEAQGQSTLRVTVRDETEAAEQLDTGSDTRQQTRSAESLALADRQYGWNDDRS